MSNWHKQAIESTKIRNAGDGESNYSEALSIELFIRFGCTNIKYEMQVEYREYRPRDDPDFDESHHRSSGHLGDFACSLPDSSLALVSVSRVYPYVVDMTYQDYIKMDDDKKLMFEPYDDGYRRCVALPYCVYHLEHKVSGLLKAFNGLKNRERYSMAFHHEFVSSVEHARTMEEACRIIKRSMKLPNYVRVIVHITGDQRVFSNK
jgi:hypothetical protein